MQRSKIANEPGASGNSNERMACSTDGGDARNARKIEEDVRRNVDTEDAHAN